MSAWAVKGETEHGELTIRTFETREEAEDHPVKLSLWKRVWVERVAERPLPAIRTCRPPWSVEEPAGRAFTCLRDADGGRVATLHGSYEERQRAVAILRERGLLG